MTKLHTLVKRGLLIAVIFSSYIWVLRPARQYYTTNIVKPKVAKWVDAGNRGESSEVSLESKSNKSFFINFSLGGIKKEIIYSPQAGFFLLVACISLAFLTLKWQYYLFLGILHFSFELLVVIGLWVGSLYSLSGFILADFIISYLSPVISLGMIPTIMFFRGHTLSLKDHL